MGILPNGAGGITSYLSAFGVGASGAERAPLADRNQENVMDILKTDMEPVWEEAFEKYNTGMAGMLLRIVTGVSSELTGAFRTIGELVSLRWAQVDNHESYLGDLQDRTQNLEGVIGYGCRYMSSSPGVTTTKSTMPFDTNVGPMVGVTPLSGGRFRLDSKGLWRFESQLRFWGAALAPPECFMDILIRKPDGSEFARLSAIASSSNEITVTNVMPVVVPTAGYTAEVQAWTSALPVLGTWRGIGGGLGTTRFSVFKISSETE